MEFTLKAVLQNSVEKYADEIFISGIEKNSFTYKEVGEKVESISAFLIENGIIKGDKVSILGENSPHWGIAFLAITTIGAVAVPIMTEFHDSEVHHCIRHSESKAIFISSKLYEKISEADLPELSTIILLDDFSIIPNKMKYDLLKEVLKTGRKEFAKIKAAAKKLVGKSDDHIAENDFASILYTSGTTGHSKGVILTHKNIVYDAFATIKLVKVGVGDRLLSILPLFHTIESTLGFVTPMMVGATIFYIDKPPTAAVLLPALQKVKPTVMLSVPLVIEKIYHNRVLAEINEKGIVRTLYKVPMFRKKLNKIAGKKLLKTFGSELRMFCIGGAALPLDVEKFMREADFPYAIGYGLTETAPLVTGTPPEGTMLGSAGKPLEGMQIKIDNPDPETGEGEVLIKGPNVMKGYYKDEEKTKAVLQDNGWFRSGDLGLIKDDYLYIKGRLKNVIIGSNGKNIYPEEIETIINENEYVAESLVHEKEGKLIARVHFDYEMLESALGISKMENPEARNKIEKLSKELLESVNSRLSSFSKLKKIVEQQEPFEKTPTKKIKRYLYV